MWYRTVPVLSLLILALLWCTAPAGAQPVNNDRGDATVIPEPLPYTDSLNTADATTEPDDPDCVGNGPTIWYTFTPSADIPVAANTFGSDYDTSLSVYTDDGLGGLIQVICNDDFNSLQSQVIWQASADTTYLIMVGAFASGPGGNLVLTVEEALPLLVIEVGLDAKSSVRPKTGVVTVKGTVLCNTPAQVFFVAGELQQRKGRALISAFWQAPEFTCEPPATAWSAEAVSSTGLFTGGGAQVRFVQAFACSSQTCDDVFIEGPIGIHLTGKKP